MELIVAGSGIDSSGMGKFADKHPNSCKLYISDFIIFLVYDNKWHQLFCYLYLANSVGHRSGNQQTLGV